MDKSTKIKYWIKGARPKTFPNAISPVLCGVSSALFMNKFNLLKSILLLLLALFIIIGANYINDYADGIKGTDDNRVGPQRLVGGKIFPANQVKFAAILSLIIAAIIGFFLVWDTNKWLFIIGVLIFLAAWNYTAGKNPYGYLGFGELMVFIFFGLVAVLGSCYIIAEKINFISLMAAIIVGLFSCSVLLVNNIRDIDEDKINNKITLAVRLGNQNSRRIYFSFNLVIVGLSILVAITINIWFLTLLIVTPILIRNTKLVLDLNNTNQLLIPGIATTGIAMLIWSIIFSVISIFVN